MIVQFDSEQNFIAELSPENAFAIRPPTEETIDVAFSDNVLLCDLASGDSFVCLFSNGTSAGDYDGRYVVTPSNQTQTLPTASKTLAQNIIVNPIPSNYGLVTWNGSTMTIS